MFVAIMPIVWASPVTAAWPVIWELPLNRVRIVDFEKHNPDGEVENHIALL